MLVVEGHRHLRAWLFSAAVALVGFLLLVLVVILVGTPIAWEVPVGFLFGTPVAAALCSRSIRMRWLEIFGYTFALVLLCWPVLTFLAYFVRYWLTGKAIGN
jgi:hypothetical protein